jgi:two-component system nitrogen regulation response regulator NtrX
VPEEVIEPHHIPASFHQCFEQVSTSNALDQPNFKTAKVQFEKEYLRKKLEEHKWNISKTAVAIGIERSHLHRKLKAYGVQQEKSKQ